MRERGELQEIRELLGQNIKELENVRDSEFMEVGRQVNYNLQEAFKKHSSEVEDLDKKYRKKYNIGLTSITVSGTLNMVSLLYPSLAQYIGVVSQVVGAGSLLELVRDFCSKREELQTLQKKPVATLFDVHNK